MGHSAETVHGDAWTNKKRKRKTVLEIEEKEIGEMESEHECTMYITLHDCK